MIVEDILETEDSTVNIVWDVEKKEKKKSVRSVMKGILKKGKKGISKAMGNKERPSKKNKHKEMVRMKIKA